MPDEYNVYCDESCHLERDGNDIMVLGALWCPKDKAQAISGRLRGIKALHGLSPSFEAKWTKVSPAQARFYLNLINYFFSEDDLHFRAWITIDKHRLAHDMFRQTHDEWYYKMYFGMLKSILSPRVEYNIYLDIKDTRGADKVRKLHGVLCSSLYDFRKDIVKKVQLVRSHEIEQLQLADLLIGAVSYANRGLNGSSAKQELVERIRAISGYSLTRSTLIQEQKVNLFHWRPKDAMEGS